MPINNGGGSSGITIEVDPNSVPLSGGSMTGTLYVPEIRNLLNENLVIDAYNDDAAGTHNLFKFNPYGGGFELPANSAGIKIDPVGGQYIAKGSFDSGRGGYNGISIVCANHYELNWQSGYLKNVYGNAVAPINVEESNLVLLQNRDGIEEGEIPPYIRTLTISGYGLSQVGNNEVGDFNFSLNHNCVGGVVNSDNNWGLNTDGVSGRSNGGYDGFNLNNVEVRGFNDYGQSFSFGCGGLSAVNNEGEPADNTFALNSSKVSGHIDSYETTIDDEPVTIPAKDWEFGVDGAKFVDGTVQTTAGLPLTGGTVTNPTDSTCTTLIDGGYVVLSVPAFDEVTSIELDPLTGINYNEYTNNNSVNITQHSISVTGGNAANNPITIGWIDGYDNGDFGIKFPDNTVQTTAGEKGDRYKATSSSSHTVDSGNGKSFNTHTNLAYTPYCKIVIVATGTSNRMYCTVVSYNEATGILVVDADTHTGSGTHTDWVINIGG